MVIKINEKLKNNLKIISIKKGTTMTDIIVEGIRKYVEKNKEL